MEGLSGPRDAGGRRLRHLAVGAAVVVALFATLLVSELPRPVLRWVSGLGLVAAGCTLAASFADRFRRTVGRRRQAWLCFGIAAVLATLSNALLLVFGSQVDRRSPGDNVLILALLIGIVGMVRFPLAKRRGTDLARMLLDGIVIGGSVLFIASITLFPQIADESRRTGLLVTVVDIVIATVATLLMLRGAPQDRVVLGLTAAGFVAISCSDFGFAVATAQTGSFTFGSIVDIGWIAGYLLLALAVRGPGNAASPADERPLESSPVPGTVVMFVLVLGAAVLSLTSPEANILATPPGALWLLVLLAVLGRQIMLVVDNERLRRILERQVRDRSRSLRQVTQQSDLLVNSVGDGIYGVDQRGLITFVNPVASRVLSYAASELIGRDAHATFHASAPDGSTYPVDSCYITEAIRDQQVTSAEADNYRRLDGQVIPVEVTASPLIADGVSVGAVVVFRDITQRHEVDRMKSEFVSMVSHELRTPLTAIRGSLGLVAGGALGAVSTDAARMIDIALLSCERLTRLINEILDLERVESGISDFDLAPHPARTLIDSALGQVGVLAEQAGISVAVGAVQGEVQADADRVVQTLLNLIGNAIKFSESGQHVEVGAVPRGPFVEFIVTDHGRGIPADKLDAIFGRFVQVDSSDARDKGGSGLGLAISRSIVEKLGGRIWAENNPEGGATFHFTLPTPDRQVEPDPTQVDGEAPARRIEDRPAPAQSGR